jgi:hypothetical protein
MIDSTQDLLTRIVDFVYTTDQELAREIRRRFEPSLIAISSTPDGQTGWVEWFRRQDQDVQAIRHQRRMTFLEKADDLNSLRQGDEILINRPDEFVRDIQAIVHDPEARTAWYDGLGVKARCLIWYGETDWTVHVLRPVVW